MRAFKWILFVAGCLALGLWVRALSSAPVSEPLGGYQVGAERPATLQCEWRYARNRTTTGYVDSNDTTPDPNAMTWQETGAYFVIPYEWTYVSLSFLCYGDGSGDGDPNGGTFDVNVYIVDTYSSWDHVAEFSVAVGELEATHNPTNGAQFNSGSLDPNESYKWGEGPFSSVTGYSWLSTPQYSGATNTIGRMTFDAYGGRVLVVLLDNRSSITRIYPLVKGR